MYITCEWANIVRFGVHPATNHKTGVFVMGNVSHWMSSKTIYVCMLIYCRYSPEGVVFLLSGLAKQTRQGKPRAEYCFSCLFVSNAKLCPQRNCRHMTKSSEQGDDALSCILLHMWLPCSKCLLMILVHSRDPSALSCNTEVNY